MEPPKRRNFRDIAPFERAARAREPDKPPDPAIEEMREAGAFFPGEFIAPIVTTRFDRTRPDEPVWSHYPTFMGSSTLIGRDLLLSARHVLDPAFADPDLVPAAAINHLESSRVFFTRLDEYECHPESSCDLAIARLTEWNARCMFRAFAEVSPLNDVVAVGYPYELLAPIHQGDLRALDNPRYLKGYVTRGIDTARDDFAPTACFEVSFPFDPGMSGSPVWGYDSDTHSRVLVGIAIGAQAQATRVERTEAVTAEGVREVRDVFRLRDFGVATRLSAVLDWQIEMLDGTFLGDLIPNDGSGVLPAPLEYGSDEGRPDWRIREADKEDD